MKIVKIIGGLGNQMFQYALYLSLRNRYPNEEVLTDTSYFSSYKAHNGLELERVFGLKLNQASFKQLLMVTIPVRSFKLSRFIRKLFPKRSSECLEAKDYTFNENVFSNQSMYYDGYWQNIKYFDEVSDIVRDAFTFQIKLNKKTNSLANYLAKTPNTVSIHIRRGDYLKAPNYIGLCNIDYYTKSIEYIKTNIANPIFIVFSNDIEWCKTNIIPLLSKSRNILVSWNNGEDSSLDMYLMSKCNHNIIANSSFSWWSAFLNNNPNKIVCAPKKWTNTKVNCSFQLPEWILF